MKMTMNDKNKATVKNQRSSPGAWEAKLGIGIEAATR
jgi:hypothetical protein